MCCREGKGKFLRNSCFHIYFSFLPIHPPLLFYIRFETLFRSFSVHSSRINCEQTTMNSENKHCTVNSPVTDTLLSGQLHLRTLSPPRQKSVFTHSRRRTISSLVKTWTRTLLKRDLWYLFIVFSLSGHSMLALLYTLTNEVCLITQKPTKTWPLTLNNDQWESVFSSCPFLAWYQERVSVPIFGYLIKHNEYLLINSPVSGHPSNFSLVPADENNSHKQTVALTKHFSIPEGVHLQKSWLYPYIYTRKSLPWCKVWHFFLLPTQCLNLFWLPGLLGVLFCLEF